jgi:hypothetical protein
MDDVKVLCAALLWARNHLEVGNQSVRDEVIECLDRVLKHREPTAADMQRFRLLYPIRKDRR